MDIKDYQKILMYNPYLNLSCIYVANKVSLYKLARAKINLELARESHKNYMCKCHLREPFLERLYKMKGLVI